MMERMRGGLRDGLYAGWSRQESARDWDALVAARDSEMNKRNVRAGRYDGAISGQSMLRLRGW